MSSSVVIVWVFHLDLNLSLLLWDRQTAGTSLEWKLKYTSCRSRHLTIHTICLGISTSIWVLLGTLTWRCIIGWFWWIENWWWRVVSQMKYLLSDRGLLLMVIARSILPIFSSWSLRLSRILLTHNDLVTERVHVLDIFYYAMLLHILNKALLLLWSCWLSYWLCDRGIFYFKATR